MLLNKRGALARKGFSLIFNAREKVGRGEDQRAFQLSGKEIGMKEQKEDEKGTEEKSQERFRYTCGRCRSGYDLSQARAKEMTCCGRPLNLEVTTKGAPPNVSS